MKKIFLPLLTISILAFAYTETDVSNANYLATKGIITQQSTTAGFRLNDTITRAEAVGIALKIRGINLPSAYYCKNYFSDVAYNPNNNWICRAVELAADAGLVSRANTIFRPQDNITRAEALAMVINAGGISFDKNAYCEKYTMPGTNFSCDALKVFDPSIQNWQFDIFLKYYGEVLGKGVGSLTGNIDLRSNSNATRAEVFGFAKNIIEYQLTLSSTCALNSSNFTCGSVTQGYEDPNNPPPQVCGCRPTCPDGEAVIVSQGSGFWSDGSPKGTFVCSAEYPA